MRPADVMPLEEPAAAALSAMMLLMPPPLYRHYDYAMSPYARYFRLR